VPDSIKAACHRVRKGRGAWPLLIERNLSRERKVPTTILVRRGDRKGYFRGGERGRPRLLLISRGRFQVERKKEGGGGEGARIPLLEREAVTIKKILL